MAESMSNYKKKKKWCFCESKTTETVNMVPLAQQNSVNMVKIQTQISLDSAQTSLSLPTDGTQLASWLQEKYLGSQPHGA